MEIIVPWKYVRSIHNQSNRKSTLVRVGIRNDVGSRGKRTMEISRTAALRSSIPEIAECAQVIKITTIIIPETASAGRKAGAVG